MIKPGKHATSQTPDPKSYDKCTRSNTFNNMKLGIAAMRIIRTRVCMFANVLSRNDLTNPNANGTNTEHMAQLAKCSNRNIVYFLY